MFTNFLHRSFALHFIPWKPLSLPEIDSSLNKCQPPKFSGWSFVLNPLTAIIRNQIGSWGNTQLGHCNIFPQTFSRIVCAIMGTIFHLLKTTLPHDINSSLNQSLPFEHLKKFFAVVVGAPFVFESALALDTSEPKALSHYCDDGGALHFQVSLYCH